MYYSKKVTNSGEKSPTLEAKIQCPRRREPYYERGEESRKMNAKRKQLKNGSRSSRMDLG